MMSRVASALAPDPRRRRAPQPCTVFNSFRAGRDLREDRRERGAEIPDAYEEARATAARIEEALSGPEHDPVPCHNDLLAANFIRGDADQIWIVDWEYAGMGDRYFDLANFAVNNELDPCDERALLHALLRARRRRTAQLAALALMKFMSRLPRGDVGRRPERGLRARLRLHGLRPQAFRAHETRSPPTTVRARARGGQWRSGVTCPDAARCVIIGGGVGGTSIAYHLGELGWDDMVLVDRDQLTSGSTFHSAGLVGQTRGSVSLTKMMMYSVELYRRIGEESEFDPGWTECGGIKLASSEERMEELRRQAGLGEDVRAAAGADLGRRGEGEVPADVHRGRAGRRLASHRRLPRPLPAHLRPGRRRPPRRLRRLHEHPGRPGSRPTAAACGRS